MFQEHQRHQLITRLQRETLHIMKTNQGLSDSVNFHSFCRLLSCLKGNFRLDEICQQVTYKDWIEALSNFTKNSFAAWEEVSDSSLAYIMARERDGPARHDDLEHVQPLRQRPLRVG